MERLYMKRENRDAAWAAQGRKGKRSSVRGQLLHPMYVEDYETVTGRVLTAADKGFGNTIYKTPFAVLYTLETVQDDLGLWHGSNT